MGPYTVDANFDVPLASTESIIRGEQGRTLSEPSRVQIYANRESIDIFYTITVGPDQITSDLSASINAVIGDMPIIPDDLIADTFGDTGAEIIIRARNVDAAAAREARVYVFVTPIDDDILRNAMARLNA